MAEAQSHFVGKTARCDNNLIRIRIRGKDGRRTSLQPLHLHKGISAQQLVSSFQYDSPMLLTSLLHCL
jgi:hypothetical protein